MNTPAAEFVTRRIEDGIAILSLNRPETRNPLSTRMIDALTAAFIAVRADNRTRVVVLTGAGEAFCAGVDLKALQGDQDFFAGDALGVDAPLIKAIRECPVPVLGAINGFAITGGFELALACDFLYAAESARFADTHGRVGLVPGWGLTQKLSRLVGINRAREISFTGNFVTARQALEWGLVNRVVADSDLLPEVLNTAGQIVQCDQDALLRIKRLMNDGWEQSLSAGLQLEGDVAREYNPRKDVSNMIARLAELKARSRTQT